MSATIAGRARQSARSRQRQRNNGQQQATTAKDAHRQPQGRGDRKDAVVGWNRWGTDMEPVRRRCVGKEAYKPTTNQDLHETQERVRD
jgi:hypothetical protein